MKCRINTLRIRTAVERGTIIMLSGTDEQLMTTWFDVWLTNQQKEAFHSRSHIEIEYSS